MNRSTHFKPNTVFAMLGIPRHRVAYAHEKGYLPIQRRPHTYHWYTADEVARIASYFGVPVPTTVKTALSGDMKCKN